MVVITVEHCINNTVTVVLNMYLHWIAGKGTCLARVRCEVLARITDANRQQVNNTWYHNLVNMDVVVCAQDVMACLISTSVSNMVLTAITCGSDHGVVGADIRCHYRKGVAVGAVDGVGASGHNRGRLAMVQTNLNIRSKNVNSGSTQ